MIIPSFYNHESYTSAVKSPSKVHEDSIVFRAKDRDGKWVGRSHVIRLEGSWLLEDKIIKVSWRNDLLALPVLSKGKVWHGPFYVGENDVKVSLPPWEDTVDFFSVMLYLALQRKPYWALVETHTGIKDIKGKAKDVEEFKHLYLDIEERKRILEIGAE